MIVGAMRRVGERRDRRLTKYEINEGRVGDVLVYDGELAYGLAQQLDQRRPADAPLTCALYLHGWTRLIAPQHQPQSV